MGLAGSILLVNQQKPEEFTRGLIFQIISKMFRKGHVQIQSGPLEIIIGEGLGPNRPVTDFFQKYWGCTFAQNVLEGACTNLKWATGDNYWRGPGT